MAQFDKFKRVMAALKVRFPQEYEKAKIDQFLKNNEHLFRQADQESCQDARYESD